MIPDFILIYTFKFLDHLEKQQIELINKNGVMIKGVKRVTGQNQPKPLQTERTERNRFFLTHPIPNPINLL